MKIAKWLKVAFFVVFGGALLTAVYFARPVETAPDKQARVVHLQSRQAARELAARMQEYLDDNDGRLPDAYFWIDALRPYVGEDWENVSVPAKRSADGKPYYFLFFDAVSGVDVASVLNPQQVPLFFESAGAPFNMGGLEELAWPHSGNAVVVFLDGHVESMPTAWQLETVVVEFLPETPPE